MAKSAKTSRSTRERTGGGRGSPEAVAKRRAARSLNTMFGTGASGGPALDGRTEKRRQRLIAELREGRRNGRPLKALEVLVNTNELLELGETMVSIRKNGAKTLHAELDSEDMEVVHRTQKEYGFRPEAWRMLGIDLGDAERAPRRRERRRAA